MLKKILIGLALLICFSCISAYVAIRTIPIGQWTFDDSERVAAETAFYDELSTYACATQQDIRDVAGTRGWIVRDHETFDWCISEDNLTGWISVEIEPPYAFSTEDENRRYFGFDANGCRAAWRYSSC